MKHGEVQQQLTATNRWWRADRGWEKQDPDLRTAREAPFDYSAGVLANLTPGGLYVLRGPRRVGKSVEVKRTISSLIEQGTDPRRIVHMSVDGWRADDLGRLIDGAESLTPAGGSRFWFIDEITGIDDGWPERIKWLRDNDSRFSIDTVVLTGSSAADLTAATKALAGRRGPALDSDRVLLPIGFRTFARLTAETPEPDDSPSLRLADVTPKALPAAARDMAPWLDSLVRAWEVYLRVGGFPQAVASHFASRAADPALDHALFDAIHGDAFRRASWSRVQIRSFLRRIGDGLCSPVNLADMASDLQVARPTVQRRLDDLRDTFVTWSCHQERDLHPRPGAQAKVYFTDPAYNTLARAQPLDLAVMSEQQVGTSLLRALERDRPGHYADFDRVLHHRSRTRKEVDFVGPDFPHFAIESKYVDGRWRRAAQTLKASRRHGIVATRSELNLDDPDVTAMPAAMLAWLVDT